MNDIIQKLDELAETQSLIDLHNLEKKRLIDEAIPAEIKAKIAEIEAEFSGKSETAQANIEKLTSEIKQSVLFHGESVKGSFLHAVMVKGRVSWDTKGLEGYSVAHPEMSAFRKEGEPSVTIRRI